MGPKTFLELSNSERYELFKNAPADPDIEAAVQIHKNMLIEKAEKQDDGSMKITAWASTEDVDSEDDIVLATAFSDTLPEYMEFPIVLINHVWRDKPVGQTLTATVHPGKGLKVEIEIVATSEGKDVQLLIEKKILRALSIGFWILKWQSDDETGIRTITKALLAEISIVNIPANRNALIEEIRSKQITFESDMFKSLTVTGGSASGDNRRRVPKMNPEEIAKIVAKVLEKAETKVDTLVATKISDIKDDFASLKRTFGEFETKANDVRKDFATASELKTLQSRMEDDVKKAMDRLNEIDNLTKIRRDKIPFTEVRQLMPHYFGLSKVDVLFRTPVEYDSHPDAEVLKAARHYYDCIYLMDTMFRRTKGGYAGPQSLKYWEPFRALIGYIDPDFAKAMDTAESGAGLEWVWEGWSQELFDLYRLRLSMESRFPSFNMPSATFKWPILSGTATAYKAAEATTSTPSALTSSTIGTANITFDAEDIAVHVRVSPQLIEDSIIDMGAVIREESAYALSYGVENCIVNGDTTATHRDSDTTSAADVRKCWDGLRDIAATRSASFDVQSTTAGVGDATAAFVAQDIRYARKQMGKWGVNPAECVIFTSISGMFTMMSLAEVTKANEFGSASTWLTGVLPVIDGCEIVPSAAWRADLAADGDYDGVTMDNTSFATVNVKSCKMGNRRDITLEFDKDIRVQQWSFVTTARKDFQCMAPSTEDPMYVGYNINA